MERYYPNFYSPSSACYEPLDPRLKRRSLVDLTKLNSDNQPSQSEPKVQSQLRSNKTSENRSRPSSITSLGQLAQYNPSSLTPSHTLPRQKFYTQPQVQATPPISHQLSSSTHYLFRSPSTEPPSDLPPPCMLTSTPCVPVSHPRIQSVHPVEKRPPPSPSFYSAPLPSPLPPLPCGTLPRHQSCAMRSPVPQLPMSPAPHFDPRSKRSFSFRFSTKRSENRSLTLPMCSTIPSNSYNQDCTISAYEHSFTNMKSRLQSLNASAAEKDNELQSLRSTISSLRREANLPPFSPSPTSSINLHGRACSVEPSVSTPDLHARSNSMSTSVAATPPMRRAACQKTKQSTDSENVLHSAHSFSSLASNSTSGSPLDNQQNEHTSHTRRGPRKSWLRNSLGRAFRRKSKGSSEMEAMADSISIRQSDSVETECESERVRPNSTPYSEKLDSSDQSDTALNMETLRRELAEKNMMLTDLQLSALSSAHQVEQMKEQILNLKADKERLEQCLSSALSSRTGSEQTDRSSTAEDDTDFTDSNNPRLLVSPSQANEVILNSKLSPDNDSGIGDQSALSKDEDVIIDPSNEPSPPAKRVVVRIPALSLSQPQLEHSPSVDNKSHTLIGCLSIDPNTTWIELENSVRKLFKTFTHHIDPSTRLGLGNDSIIGLKLGSSQAICRDSISVIKQTPYSFLEESTQSNSSSSGQSPDNQYLTLIMRSTENHSDLANSSNLAACLDALALETLVPRTILQRYIALVLEHKRIILCGPSGTGKTYLANRLADFLVSRSGSQGDISQSMIGRFKVEPKSNKELRAYLSTIADLSMRCSDSRQEEQKCPTVIIVDNLHHVPCLADIFNSFLSSVSPLRCPYIIGTMNQSTFSANNLQLHHNFRWVLCANHMEPVKGFLGRYLRRKLLQTEIVTKKKHEKLGKVVVWISSLWQMLNDFLESHASSDVTIGPRLFLACPMKLEDSQVWFCDLWNYSLVPYLLEALREGIQTFGKRAIWRDPVDWILSTWPWSSSSSVIDEFSSPLIRLRPEDVGYDSQLFGTCSPLLNPPSPLANSSHAAGINKPSSSRTPASYHTTSSKATSFVYPPYLSRNSSSSEMSSNSNNGESYKATLMQMKPLRLMSHEHDVI